jgi:hypothetical protein
MEGRKKEVEGQPTRTPPPPNTHTHTHAHTQPCGCEAQRPDSVPTALLISPRALGIRGFVGGRCGATRVPEVALMAHDMHEAAVVFRGSVSAGGGAREEEGGWKGDRLGRPPPCPPCGCEAQGPQCVPTAHLMYYIIQPTARMHCHPGACQPALRACMQGMHAQVRAP